MLRELWYRLRSVIGRARMDREIAEELNDHVRRQTERNVERGMSAAEAQRTALVSFGGVERYSEIARDELRSRPLEDFVHDVQYAVRTLLRAPVFAVVATLSLALGVGANTAMFSVVDGVLLKPLPYPDPDRLVRLGVELYGQDAGTSASYADMEALLGARSFESVGAHVRAGGVTWTHSGEAEILLGTHVTPPLLEALGVEPLMGRLMLTSEGAVNAPRVVLLGYEFWRDRFGADRDVVGRTMMLDGDAHTVIGVMPAGFRLPSGAGDAVWPVLQLEAVEDRGPFWLTVTARLAPGVSAAQAASELALIQDAVKARYVKDNANWSYFASPLQSVLVRDTRATILVLFGAVALVLVIAAANVANLLLARATARGPELAIRSALGAGRGRLLRQLIAEGVVLAGLGAAVGVILAYGGVALLGSLTPDVLPRLHEIRVDGRVLLFTASVALLTGLFVGLAPALRIPRGALREAGRGGSATRERSTMRNVLVVAEFALALTVLIGAALLGNSLLRLQRVDPGAATTGVLALRLGLPEAGYDEAAVGRFFDDLLDGVRALPGVQAAGVSMAVPPHRLVMRNPFTPEGRVYGPQDAVPNAHVVLVTPGFFDAIGARLHAGRDFSRADKGDAARVAIIDETMAQRYYADRDAVNGTIRLSDDPTSPPLTIVGIAPHVRYAGLEVEREPTVYLPYAGNLWWRTMYLVVRSAGDPLLLLPAIRAQVADLDPDVPLREVRTMEELMREAVAEPRFRTLLLSTFAALALVLASAGIYGVLSYTVQQRRREMSIRLVLGARRHEIIALVVGRGVALAAVGVVLGLAMAAALTGMLRSILFGVGTLDPATFAAAAGFLLAVALLASWIPAMRASRAEPAATLRAE